MDKEQKQISQQSRSWISWELFPTSYPGMNARGWSDGPESVTGQISCELGIREDSRWRTEIDSKRTGCGWCAAGWTAL